MTRSRVVATSLLLVVGLALGGQPAFAASHSPETLSTDGGYGVTETEANLMYHCSGEGTYSYEVDSSHTAVVGGQTYGAGTVGANRFAC